MGFEIKQPQHLSFKYDVDNGNYKVFFTYTIYVLLSAFSTISTFLTGSCINTILCLDKLENTPILILLLDFLQDRNHSGVAEPSETAWLVNKH